MKTNKNHTSIDPFTHEIDSIPKAAYQRIVIVGGGFAGLRLARELKGTDYQVVMLDKNNYHQFQPLFYQVATSGLEPSAISFPIRKVFKKHDNLFFRMMELLEVDTAGKRVITDKGFLTYDHLVLAMGGDTAYFGMKNVQKICYAHEDRFRGTFFYGIS
ncbi:NAD(P)/FAD-dependent oxidoreductase [Nitritalea halalkaliphila]|uniref:NAD(P)/FAD-dependent oxidoreductase n=1 Tax=Nitritalea halalkaliphila TaxID=590849 RepID=UPI0002D69939|nr:FAD-dependent oxidoreductase [Nitritalea halalkaliphila]